jgi:transposase
MKKRTRFLGLDVHADTIAVAVAEPGRDGEVRSLGMIPNTVDALSKLIRKVGIAGLEVCYEAGPTGYAVYWQLTRLGVPCVVVAPTLIPVKAGDRVKTDRRDALKLARLFRSGDLTAVWIPDAEHEALRDLVRAREAAKKDQLRARHRLAKFLLRRGLRRDPSMSRAWGKAHWLWIKSLRFDIGAQEATYLDYVTEVEHAAQRVVRLEKALDVAAADAPPRMRAVIDALQSLRGIAKLTAVSVVAELGEISRFTHPRQLMGYSGLVPSERSSGQSTSRGGITKTGNAHLRRVLVEAAWAYRHRPHISPQLKARQKNASERAKAIAWKAQHRLSTRYRRLHARGKPLPQVAAAIARELLGFIWAIGVETEASFEGQQHAA